MGLSLGKTVKLKNSYWTNIYLRP